MKKKSLLMMALLVGFAMAVYSFASSTASLHTRTEQARGLFSYAQLTIRGEDRVSWDKGGSELPRVRPLNAVYRDLGGNQRVTVANLLNVIGQQGWELVQTDQVIWTFKRRN